MKHFLNTLFVTTDGAYIRREGDTIAVEVERETRVRIPVHTLSGLVCFGNVLCTPALFGLCAEHGVCVSFLTEYGRFLARVEGPVRGNVLLRRAQYDASSDESAARELTRGLVAAKLTSSRSGLRRAARDQSDPQAQDRLSQAADRIGNVIGRCARATSLDELRGLEGEGAKYYFEVFQAMILTDDPAFAFEKRSRRPPMNPINAMLSFVYTLLTHDIRGALEATGLDPAVGFLHRMRPGRPSLALDLLEELRAYIADRLILSLVNRRQVTAKDFHTSESGAVTMENDARKRLLVAYQERKQKEILHPFIGETISLGLLPHVQAQLLARHLRGDLNPYPPYVWRG
ncbi:MAG: type I-C CRISPR-associated endonuclease Cas1 [Candidatus Hydrogenedentes bacterium]|nr:type I-C CRISPR-associated endonuclease Cas1 [Candidatus Hydrogenedentota bacterium]